MQHHYWIIERHTSAGWQPLLTCFTRSEARDKKKKLSWQTRIRKFIAA
ncbi:hypothetical protein [Bordetella genomosp. 9]|nr:hypothetical protein [Bordetella genomosp. 9]